MDKLWGWLNLVDANSQNSGDLLTAMGEAAHARSVSTVSLIYGACALAADNRHSVAEEGGLCVALIGQPRLEDTSPTASPAQQLLALPASVEWTQPM